MIDILAPIIEKLINPPETLIERWPSCYPPNVWPRAETVDGQLVSQDRLGIPIVTEFPYAENHSVDARIQEVFFEDTRNNTRQAGERGGMSLLYYHLKSNSAMYFSFGSCNCCYRTRARDFTDTNRTPHPMNVPISSPNLAQIGLCGCIICNACVGSVVNHPTNIEKDFVHCPYCGNAGVFSRHLRIWAVSEEVSNLYHSTQPDIDEN